MEIDDFTLGYITCALWSSMDDNGEPLDSRFSIGDIQPEALKQMAEECKDFQNNNAHLETALYSPRLSGLDYTSERAGHDFWLTRNGHGAGFWDRGLGDVGDKLTELAYTYGSCDLFVFGYGDGASIGIG